VTTASADPNRFKPFHESLLATVVRTGSIAIIVASIVTVIRLHHAPISSVQWHNWLALAVFVGWITFGGHWVEIAYLNGLRPKIAPWSDAALVCVRLAIWLAGGAILFLCAIVSLRLLIASELPDSPHAFKALLQGGPIFVVVELCAHTFLLLTRRPSFWNFRG
jgi:hypothetical protein